MSKNKKNQLPIYLLLFGIIILLAALLFTTFQKEISSKFDGGNIPLIYERLITLFISVGAAIIVTSSFSIVNNRFFSKTETEVMSLFHSFEKQIEEISTLVKDTKNLNSETTIFKKQIISTTSKLKTLFDESFEVLNNNYKIRYINDAVIGYERLLETISESCEELLLVGEGYTCHTSQSRHQAEAIKDIILNKLRNDSISIKRFQYSSSIGMTWLKELIAIKNEFSTRFHVYMGEVDQVIKVDSVMCINICLAKLPNNRGRLLVGFSKESDEENLYDKIFNFSVEINGSYDDIKKYQNSFTDFFDDRFDKTVQNLKEILVYREEIQKKYAKTLFSEFTDPTKIPHDRGFIIKKIREFNSGYPENNHIKMFDTNIFRLENFNILHENKQLFFAFGYYMDNNELWRLYDRKRNIQKTGFDSIGLAKLKGHKLILIPVTYKVLGSKAITKITPNIIQTGNPEDYVCGKLWRVSSDRVLQRIRDKHIRINYSLKKKDLVFEESHNNYNINCLVLQNSKIKTSDNNAILDSGYKDKMLTALYELGLKDENYLNYIKGL